MTISIQSAQTYHEEQIGVDVLVSRASASTFDNSIFYLCVFAFHRLWTQQLCFELTTHTIEVYTRVELYRKSLCATIRSHGVPR